MSTLGGVLAGVGAKWMAGDLGEPDLQLPLRHLEPVSKLRAVVEHPGLKALLPLLVFVLIAPPLWWFFRGTWKELDEEARRFRSHGQTDHRPAVCLVTTSAILTLQEYYGGRNFFQHVLREQLQEMSRAWPWMQFEYFHDLYAYGWWSSARVLGYVIVPLVVWKAAFPRDSVLDMGLRTKGFLSHLWIYAACLAIVVPLMFIVAQQSDFGTYYPFYKKSSRSIFDFFVWESMYWAQFFALEFFFRGWMVGALRRSLGSAAIFVMAVPYCMIHYGKPYLEAHGAVIAGVVLGSLAMRTRSIYAGFLLHISVAFGMDVLSLYKQGALPTRWWPPGP